MSVLVLYHLEGCPACAANWPAWRQAKKMVKGKLATKEIESKMTPAEAQVTSFPTMKVEVNGREVKRIEGRRGSGKEILTELEVQLPSRRRSRTYRRSRHISRRNLRHRTLRNYVALR